MQSHMGEVGGMGDAMKRCAVTQTDVGDVHGRSDGHAQCAAMWSGTGKAGGEHEHEGVAGYCEGKGPRRLADERWSGKGMDTAEGWHGCQMGSAGGDLAWWVEEVNGRCALCVYLGLGIDSATSGKR
jgi:hypothetical protein